MLLSGHESKSLSHFHEEVPDVRKNCRLQIGLCKGIFGTESQKFCHDGTFEKFKLMLGFCYRFLFHFCNDGFFFRRMEQPIIILCANVAVKGANTPIFISRFIHIPNTGIFIGNTKQSPKM